MRRREFGVSGGTPVSLGIVRSIKWLRWGQIVYWSVEVLVTNISEDEVDKGREHEIYWAERQLEIFVHQC